MIKQIDFEFSSDVGDDFVTITSGSEAGERFLMGLDGHELYPDDDGTTSIYVDAEEAQTLKAKIEAEGMLIANISYVGKTS